MNGTVVIQTNILLELVDALKTKGAVALRKKLLLSLPDDVFRYGSDLWWEQSDAKALEDIKRGNVVKFENAKDAITWLHAKTKT